MPKVVFVLAFCLFLSSLSVVYVRHQHRLEYVHLTAANSEKDDLFIEWNTLMVAMSTWSSLNQLEKSAKKKLSMRLPKAGEIVSMGSR